MLKFLDDMGFNNEEIDFLEKNYPIFKSVLPNKTLDEINYKFLNDGDEDYSAVVMFDDLFINTPIDLGTIRLLFIIDNLEGLYNKYIQNNVELEFFYDFILDIKAKADSYFRLHSVLGLDGIYWFAGFFKLLKYAIGRFQYQICEYIYDDYSRHGVSIKQGDKVLGVHIPELGGMPYETRIKSYKKAYDFFKERKYFTDGIMKLTLRSWINFPPYKKLYGEKSNLLAFSNEFEDVGFEYKDTFGDGWRIFGKEFNNEFKNLPQNTSLQKAFAEYLNTDNPKFGVGRGVMLFDGEKIIR